MSWLTNPYRFAAASGIVDIETVTGTTGTTSLTLTFSGLTNAAKCVPFVSAKISSGSMNFDDCTHITWSANVFDDAGTVKCTLASSVAPPAGAVWDFSVTLVQFASTYVVAKYSGTATVDNTNGDADIAITAVTLANAFVVGTCKITVSGIGGSESNRAFRLTSTTNVRMYGRFGNIAEGDYIFYVVSDPAAGMTVEHAYVSQAAGSWTNVDVTVTNDPRVKLVIAGSNTNSGGGFYPQRVSMSCEALNATTIRFTRPVGYDATGNPARFTAQVITIPGVTVETGVHAWANADSSEVKTVTSVNTAKAAAISLMPGNSVNAQESTGFSPSVMAYIHNKIQLTSATQVTLTRGPSTAGNTGRVGYQVLSFL